MPLGIPREDGSKTRKIPRSKLLLTSKNPAKNPAQKNPAQKIRPKKSGSKKLRQKLALI